MNKYQTAAMKNVLVKLFNSQSNEYEKLEIYDNYFRLYQNDNYTINKYSLLFTSAAIDYIEAYGSTKQVVKGYQGNFVIDIDFKDQINRIVIIFKNNIVDNITFNLEYVFADKTIYDEKLSTDLQNQLKKKASVRVTTGLALVNVLFQPVNDSYSYTIVELYSFMVDTPLLMARYKLKDDLYFCAISNLAFGTYKIRVIEYDSNDEVIYKSGFCLVTLQRPKNMTQNV